MKFILFLVTNSRRHAPRVGNFLFNDLHQKYLYLGRELTADEFNTAAASVLDKPVRNLSYTVSARAVDPKETAQRQAAMDSAQAKAQADYEASHKDAKPVEKPAPEPVKDAPPVKEDIFSRPTSGKPRK